MAATVPAPQTPQLTPPAAAPTTRTPDAARTGVLLMNLGTPDAPKSPEVRRYLREFLNDPRVLDIPAIGRWMLLNLIILPTRPAKSAEAYREVWTDAGSPLLVHSEGLRDAVAERLAGVPVELGMRYGNPSVGQAMRALRDAGCERVVVAPLYPQYASSSTGTALEAVYAQAGTLWNTPSFAVVPPFYDHPEFIASFVDVATPVLEGFQPDHVMLSYHGLPERHVTKSDTSPAGKAHCLASAGCCDAIGPANRMCYRAQCYATSRALAAGLGLDDASTSVAFQSRLGRTPWIKPYTDERIVELAKQGVKRLAVLCPAFVADCLETLEEIGMRAKEDFQQAGGEDLVLVPSLNATPRWADAVVTLLHETSPWLAEEMARQATG